MKNYIVYYIMNDVTVVKPVSRYGEDNLKVAHALANSLRKLKHVKNICVCEVIKGTLPGS